MSEQKKKFSPPLRPPFFTATLSEPHDGSSSTPVFFDWFCRKQKEKERKERRKTFSPLPSAVVLFSLSLLWEKISLFARAQNSSEIDPRSRTMTIPQSSTRTRRLRARAKKHQIFFSEKKKKKKNTREERIQTFFSFPRTKRGQTEKEEKQRDKVLDFTQNTY